VKLSEIRPCDACSGPIATGSYLLRLSMLLVNPVAVNQVMGLHTLFQGSLALAEVFAPADVPVKVAGDHEPELWTELIVCQSCALNEPLDLARLIDGAAARNERS
jgi:hypothetical protein